MSDTEFSAVLLHSRSGPAARTQATRRTGGAVRLKIGAIVVKAAGLRLILSLTRSSWPIAWALVFSGLARSAASALVLQAPCQRGADRGTRGHAVPALLATRCQRFGLGSVEPEKLTALQFPPLPATA